MNLTFYGSLNEEQKRLADLIAARAKAAGVPPELAVAVAYRESKLNPNVGRGDAGEIGIMQVKPTTGKELGFSVADLQNAERNIDAGVAYLKRSLDASDGNQKLAAVGYNAGINHPFFSGGELPGTTKKYVQDIGEFGGFAGAATKPETQAAPQVPAAPAPAADDMEKRLAAAKAEQEVRMAQMGGAGAGAALALKRGAQDVGGAVAGALNRAVSGALDDRIDRILKGTTVDDATGRARSTGFNIETAQQAARTAEADRVATALRASGMNIPTTSQIGRAHV